MAVRVCKLPSAAATTFRGFGSAIYKFSMLRGDDYGDDAAQRIPSRASASNRELHFRKYIRLHVRCVHAFTQLPRPYKRVPVILNFTLKSRAPAAND